MSRSQDHLLVDLAREVHDLHVAAAAPALADKPLGRRVEGDERARRLERAHDLFERVERAPRRVDVGLFCFVCSRAVFFGSGAWGELRMRARADEIGAAFLKTAGGPGRLSPIAPKPSNPVHRQ